MIRRISIYHLRKREDRLRSRFDLFLFSLLIPRSSLSLSPGFAHDCSGELEGFCLGI